MYENGTQLDVYIPTLFQTSTLHDIQGIHAQSELGVPTEDLSEDGRPISSTAVGRTV